MTDSRSTDDDPTPGSESTRPPGDNASGGGAGTTVTGLLESIRDAIEDVAERATPTVKEYSAKAAELTASAADKAAPLARKAGEATADASGKLAVRSRAWASEVRSALAGAGAATGTPASTDAGAPSSDDTAEAPAPEQPGL